MEGLSLAGGYDYPYLKERDPFLALVSKGGQILIVEEEKEGAPLALKGIIYSPPQNRAIINEEVVGEGGVIAGYRVVSIEENKVVLKRDNEELILKIEEEK